jgi:hypothetical protein
VSESADRETFVCAVKAILYLLQPRTCLAGYRALLAARGYDWGDEEEGATKVLARFVWCCDMDQWRSALLAEVNAPGTLADPVEAVLRALPDQLPPGIAIARRGGIEVPDPLPFALVDHPIPYQVLKVADGVTPTTVVDAVVTCECPNLEFNGHSVRAVEPSMDGRLRLIADGMSRWTVLDERGGGWFPDGAPRKYDQSNRPFFHGNDLLVEVPVGQVTVSVARGCEFRSATVTVDVSAGEEILVELSPERIYDAAARGWYGGDLHVHMNYSGDLVCTPRDAALMQEGEGLHLMNLVAANAQTALIYDSEAFEHFAGRDLPWTKGETVARWGVEYRNDMLGHFHALNPSAPPTRYQTGHSRSNEPQDWPPNSVAATEFRERGATVGYTHPVMVAMGEDGSSAEVFAPHRARSVEARELVGDAALGLVDSVDLIGCPNHIEGTEYLYHRLLGCGLRLAATAGSDVFLSHSRGFLSNPPGWFRAYADLGGQPLSVSAWQDAVRAGRTFVTNGPWLELDVDGCGPGDSLVCTGPRSVQVVTRIVGLGVEQLEIVGPAGPVETLKLRARAVETALTAEIDVRGPVWLAAIARGGSHPAFAGPQPQVYAHTSPVWVDVAGRSVARPADAEWCLDWLDRLEDLARTQGNFTAAGQFEDLVGVLDEARAFYRNITAVPDEGSTTGLRMGSATST